MSKHKKLSERPKPPSFECIIEDIEKAPVDDVVFSSSSFINGDEYHKQEKSMTMDESYLETSEMNMDNETPQEEAYKQALLFIKLQSKLKNAPKQLEEQFKRLQDVETEISNSILELKESSQALKDI